MPKGDRDDSVEAEPHFDHKSHQPDPAEKKAARRLEREQAAADLERERAEHSIFNEPAMLPNRPPVTIDCDWYCHSCGYNLRGLKTGHPCPECGRIEHYEPPREGESTYETWLATRQAEGTSRRMWLWAVAVPLLSIPPAVGCAFLTVEFAAVYNFVVFAPLVSEALKLAGAMMVVERRRERVSAAGLIYAMGVLTALVFAAAQNVVYLTIYFPSGPNYFAAYRWLIAPLLHVGCTAVVLRSLVGAWREGVRGKRPLKRSVVRKGLITAVVIHAVYNLCVYAGGYRGYGF